MSLRQQALQVNADTANAAAAAARAALDKRIAYETEQITEFFGLPATLQPAVEFSVYDSPHWEPFTRKSTPRPKRANSVFFRVDDLDVSRYGQSVQGPYHSDDSGVHLVLQCPECNEHYYGDGVSSYAGRNGDVTIAERVADALRHSPKRCPHCELRAKNAACPSCARPY